MNPFEGKFREFSKSLKEKSNSGHADAIGAKADDVYQDKPFTMEYRRIYGISTAGKNVSQIVTFATTAGFGYFALRHLITADWGAYFAGALAILFAAGVEAVKRGTLRIAAKHGLKYRTFGFAGLVAAGTLTVSIVFALIGAKELPKVIYPAPERMTDRTAVQSLDTDIQAVQSDINRLQGQLKNGQNWTAENRTLPKLQKQRAELQERRATLMQESEQRADVAHIDAIRNREQEVSRMQTYSVGAAVVAELTFLLCVLFELYYLFRAFSEREQAASNNPDDSSRNATEPTPDHNAKPRHHNANGVHTLRNNVPTQNVRAHAHADTLRTCEHCGKEYHYGHRRQKFCSDGCRITNWQTRTGKQIRHRINVPNAG